MNKDYDENFFRNWYLNTICYVYEKNGIDLYRKYKNSSVFDNYIIRCYNANLTPKEASISFNIAFEKADFSKIHINY